MEKMKCKWRFAYPPPSGVRGPSLSYTVGTFGSYADWTPLYFYGGPVPRPGIVTIA